MGFGCSEIFPLGRSFFTEADFFNVFDNIALDCHVTLLIADLLQKPKQLCWAACKSVAKHVPTSRMLACAPHTIDRILIPNHNLKDEVRPLSFTLALNRKDEVPSSKDEEPVKKRIEPSLNLPPADGRAGSPSILKETIQINNQLDYERSAKQLKNSVADKAHDAPYLKT
ncbi:hypothetical protein FQA39_LY11198 [Lamprigera yunnana]|nr:hypothetical protein FQA39_LY11198 [Lamprigera yunnana]